MINDVRLVMVDGMVTDGVLEGGSVGLTWLVGEVLVGGTVGLAELLGVPLELLGAALELELELLGAALELELLRWVGRAVLLMGRLLVVVVVMVVTAVVTLVLVRTEGHAVEGMVLE
jgi:hypothetical protein